VTSALACPYCRMTLEQAEGQITICPGCETPHHTDCFEENGGCTVFGCSSAPPPEPKLSIATPDLSATQPEPAIPVLTRVSRPPPPPPGASPAPVPPPLFSSIGYTPPQPLPYLAASLSPATGAATFQSGLPSDKDRTTFVVLGIVLGAFGAHSFYVGSTKKAFLQLALTLLSLGFAGLMVWIWAIIDVCTITTDHNGQLLRS
jgi:TM2 domain-containing membrane protein YozV